MSFITPLVMFQSAPQLLIDLIDNFGYRAPDHPLFGQGFFYVFNDFLLECKYIYRLNS